MPRPIVFGEVLFDRFPDGRRVLGGAPFNVAWHLRGLGLDPLFLSAVGDDADGREVLDAMESWGMDAAGVQRDPAHPTGAVDVRLERGEPEFTILPDRAWDFVSADRLPDVSAAPLVYHGSLASRAPASREALAALVASGRPRFVDVNLRPPFFRREDVLDLLDGARWIKLNDDELTTLMGKGPSVERAVSELLARTGAELALLTRGRHGACAFAAGGVTADVEPPPNLDVVDTVGAGDGFAAVSIVGILADWPLDTLLRRAQAFAGGIVGIRGATTSDAGFYEMYRTDGSDA
jgi:fructokinase